MGMYTELDLNIRFNINDITENQLSVLRAIGDPQYNKPPKELPDSPFFDIEGWECSLYGSSSYFVASCKVELIQEYDKVTLSIRSNFKNYDNQIDSFLDWALPLTANFKGEFLGYHRYEEYIKPTLIYKDIPRDYQVETDEELAHGFESPEC